MLVLEFNAKAKTTQYAAVSEAFQNRSFKEREIIQQDARTKQKAVLEGRGLYPISLVKHILRWSAYPSQTINFYYSNEIKTNGRYWWLNVYSPCLMSIREELGLQLKPEDDLHVTIGVWIE